MEIKIAHLKGQYREFTVLEDIDLLIDSGSINAILGVNGSGKSTLLKMLCNTLKPAAGDIFIGRRSIKKWSRRELAKKMAFLPQHHTLPGELTVGELTALGRFPHNNSAFGILTQLDRKKVDYAMEATGIMPLKHRRLAELSGGEIQRARLAMAIAQEPEIMLLDEPTAFLDISSQLSFLELLKTLNSKHTMTIVAVLHDLNLAAAMADNIIFLKDHRIFASGKTAEVMTPENILSVFGISAGITTLDSGRLHCII